MWGGQQQGASSITGSCSQLGQHLASPPSFAETPSQPTNIGGHTRCCWRVLQGCFHDHAHGCICCVCSVHRCTAVTAVVVGDRLLVANVGDSRAVLSRDGKGGLPLVSVWGCARRFQQAISLPAACVVTAHNLAAAHLPCFSSSVGVNVA